MPTRRRAPMSARVTFAALMTLIPAGAPAAAEHPAPPTQPATAAQVPVREVVLFSSGVGYFEHDGSVRGDASTELSFKREQINDILKSLLLEDLDGGRVTSVTYGSQAPLAHQLKSFGVDLTTNPPLADLLNQLRGATVTTWTRDGQVTGTVLGVEKRQRPVDKDHLVDVWVLNLVDPALGSIRPVDLEQVTEVRLADPKLQQELGKALVALAQARDQDKKPVTVHFKGQGERRVRIGYVVETPVWKTSYRLVMPDGAGAGAGAVRGAADGPQSGPATQPGAGAGAAAPGAPGKLQGWAIVENQTDNDWSDVQLSLVSGRPISFIEDLYQPLYVPRPVVQPQLYASLRPQTYEGGLDRLDREKADRFAERDEMELKNAAAGEPAVKQQEQLRKSAKSMSRRGAAAGLADDKPAEILAVAGTPMDPTASVASIASAAKVGELFQYTVGSVSLPRQQSAMIPIVTDAVTTKRLSIYNASVLPRNPLLGARLTNSTGKHLPRGPLTVLDGGSYAGDASVEDLPPGQSRLISYGVDQQVAVNSTLVKQDQSLLTGKIVKGVLELTYKQVFAQEYVAENKGDHDRALLIEHLLHPGWKLVEPAKADETTDALYRFEGGVAAGKASKLTVREELVHAQQFQVLSMDAGAVEVYARTGEIPPGVRAALAKAGQLKAAVVDTQRQVQERQQRANDITTEQNRLRENMKTVAPSSDYYKRLLQKLDEQETAMEKLQGEVKSLQEKQRSQQQDLERYLQDLDVSGDAPPAPKPAK